MKRVFLGSVDLNKDGGATVIRPYFLNLLNNLPDYDGQGRPAALNTGTMRRRIRVIEKLEALDDEASHVDLEDEDHATLVGILATAGYSAIDRNAIKIEDDVKAAKSPPKLDS